MAADHISCYQLTLMLSNLLSGQSVQLDFVHLKSAKHNCERGTFTCEGTQVFQQLQHWHWIKLLSKKIKCAKVSRLQLLLQCAGYVMTEKCIYSVTMQI